MTHEHDASSDKSWQACLYAQGEMSADERAAFEAQLENDTELCEQVAEAVMLADVVVEASHQPEISKPVSTERFQAGRFWVSTLLTACLMVALLVGNGLRQSSNPGESQFADNNSTGVSDDVVDDTMIRLWVDSKMDPDSQSSLAEADPPHGSVARTEIEQEELNVPDWMLAAVQYESKEESDDETPSIDHEEI